VRQLAEKSSLDRRTIKQELITYTPQDKIHHPRDVYIQVDGTYYGEARNPLAWVVLVARDFHNKEDLVWRFCDRETTYDYRCLRDELETLGYVVKGVTGDGFGGIRSAFSGIPFQMCHVHMERLVVKGTTRKPKTEPGQVLYALVRTLKTTNSHDFRNRLMLFGKKYHSFITEQTFNPTTGKPDWTHEGVRSAYLSLVSFLPFLFTYEQDRNIQKTSNSLEGRFRHINAYLAIHCGLGRTQKERVLHSILLASSVAPKKKKLEEIL
jgi:hypothetical protein